MTDQERRHFTRIPFNAGIQLQDANSEECWDCQLLDISLNGVLTTVPAGWHTEVGDPFRLTLNLGDDEHGPHLSMNVTVAHLETSHAGFQCRQMDVDTATHLHRLVELNLGDATILQRELSELIKQ